MQGDFTSVSAADLLVDLLRRRFTGTLRVDRAAKVKVLYVSQGDFACSSSNAEEDRLGNLLVQMGHLTPEQLDHAKAKQAERSSIGNTLVELGYITAAELLNGARRQVEEIVADLVGWREGTYQARPAPLSKEVVNLGMPGRGVVVRALQRLADRDLVVERLGGLETVLARVEPFDEAVRSLDIGLEAERILAAIDGRRSVREICEQLDLEDFDVCKTLHTLLCFGLVKRTAGAAPRALVFVEGELQNGDVLPRAGDLASRRARRAAARAAAGGQPPRLAPVPPAAPPQPASVLAAGGPSDPPAGPPPHGVEPPAAVPIAEAAGEAAAPAFDSAPPSGAGPLRRLLVWGASALGLAAVVGGIVYFTYFRPTTRPGEDEEARLIAALLEEARIEEAQEEVGRAGEAQEEEGIGAAPRPSSRPGAVKPTVPIQARPTAPGSEAARPGQQPPSPPKAEPTAPPKAAPSAASSAASAQAGAAEPPVAPALAKVSPSTMLSSDANFRSALELVGERRFREAAQAFRRALENQAPGAYSIQILLACQDATLEKSFARAAGRTLYAVPTTFRGQTCYRLFEGLYASEAEARREIDSLPAIFFEDGNRPLVVRAPRP
jgi:hypothetical protein